MNTAFAYGTISRFIGLIGCLSLLAACDRAPTSEPVAAMPSTMPVQVAPFKPGDKIEKTDAEWKSILTPNQYFILRQKGTEPPFHNEYFNNHQTGIYICAACGLPLFNSDTKFESGTGWPSFYQPIEPTHVSTSADTDLGYERDEVHCARCGGHLGHVFNDGPKPTGLRYCMDSGALKFIAAIPTSQPAQK